MYSINNPCNIRYAPSNHWRGQIGQRNGFCFFTEILYGFRAFFVLVRTYCSKYNITTVSDFLLKYAPESENDTQAYIDYVADGLAKHNFDSHISLTRDWLYWFTYYVTWYENGEIPAYVSEELSDALELYYKPLFDK